MLLSRLFALIVLVSCACVAQSPEYGGGARVALERYLTTLANEQLEAREKAIAGITTIAQVRQRQEFIRNWMRDSIGGVPPKTALKPQITGTLQQDGYHIEKLVFESLPRFYVTANVYVPEASGAPYPAVIGVAGHSDSGKAIDTYQHVWISLAKKGFVVLAFDPPGQGESLEYFDAAQGKSSVGTGTREHMMAGLQCLLTGTTFARYEVLDGIRAFDYLLTRPDVDANKIGVAGNSGGGTQAAYLAVMEPRLAAAVSSCYITSWKTLWSGPGAQDSEQVFPNFLKDGLDFADFLLAFAPKPIEMTTAIQDFFPIAGARATFAQAERLFRAADAPGRVGYFEYDDKHGWSQPRREAAYRWFARWLQGRSDDNGREPPHSTLPEKDLNVTTTGQVSTSLGGETVFTLNSALADQLFAGRSIRSLDGERARKMVAARLRSSAPSGPVQASETGAFSQGDAKVRQLRIATEADLTIPALLFRPAGQGSGNAVLFIDCEGGAAPPVVDQYLRAGDAVLAVHPRGARESSSKATGSAGYSSEYQIAMQALLVGKTIPGMQVTDSLYAFQYLRSLQGIREIRAAGRGNGAVIAVLAAALEPRISGVVTEGPVHTWMEIAHTRIHKDVVNLIVPGVLKDFDLPDMERLISPRPLKVEYLRSQPPQHP